MPFNFGSFAGGLAGGLRQGQELKLRAEESKLKAKMFEHQMKAQEFDQEIKREKAIREQQDFLNLGRAAEEYGLATSGGRPAQEQIETEIGDVPMGLQVEGQPGAAVPGRPLSPSEIYTKAALRHGKFFQGPTGTTSGGVNRAFATPQEALAFKNTPEFQAAFPYGARLTQTHYGLTWQGILPINPASAEYHGTIAQGQPKAAAQQAQQEAIYGQSAAAREGALMAEAGAVMGQPRPRMGSVISPPPQPAPALAPNAVPRSNVPPSGGPIHPGYPSGPQVSAPAVPQQSLPLQAAQAKAKAGAQGKRQVEAQEKLKDIASTEQIIGDLEALSSRINTASANKPGARLKQGTQKTVGSWLQTDTDAADLNKLRDSFSLALARSLLAERGVLTNQDRAYATNTFPSVWDTRELAQRSLMRLKTLTALQRSAEEALAAGQPFDVEAFRTVWRQMAGAAQNPQETVAPPRGWRRSQ